MDTRAVEREGWMRRGPDRRRGAQEPTARIRVVVVEDNRIMRDGLARLLAAFGDVDVVAAADSATAALQHAREHKPAIVLVDAGLQGGETYTVLSGLKSAAPRAKAIVMDFVPARQDVTQFIEAGARGFIMKDASAEDVVRAIRTVESGGELPLPPVPADAGSDAGAGQPGNAPATIRLTKREQQIKELIAAGLGNKEIAQRLNIATNTVKSHVHNMLGKLAALTPPDRRTGNRNRRGTNRRSYRFNF